ncbi:hypothetical protein [Streptomyces sp. NBC_01422]|uniref:hypothetical protein n=1 Tax=Streptomyces sp. NBC_01422 TaxID=2903859 RepID=UPI002E2B0DC2|nr:hypothetical protein [Streptomyces sp. NBC_01422]
MTDEQRLTHLLDRARRGVILPAEGEQLAGLVGELEARIATLEHVAAGNKRYVQLIVPDLEKAAARVTELEAEVARYRTAWKSARFRASAYSEGIMRLCDDRDAYQGWMEQEQAHSAGLRAKLAKSEQGRRNLRGLLEHHRDQGSLGILRTTRTRLTRALRACARYRAEVARLTAGQPTPPPADDYEQTTGHQITCCAGFTDTCTCTPA